MTTTIPKAGTARPINRKMYRRTLTAFRILSLIFKSTLIPIIALALGGSIQFRGVSIGNLNLYETFFKDETEIIWVGRFLDLDGEIHYEKIKVSSLTPNEFTATSEAIQNGRPTQWLYRGHYEGFLLSISYTGTSMLSQGSIGSIFAQRRSGKYIGEWIGPTTIKSSEMVIVKCPYALDMGTGPVTTADEKQMKERNCHIYNPKSNAWEPNTPNNDCKKLESTPQIAPVKSKNQCSKVT